MNHLVFLVQISGIVLGFALCCFLVYQYFSIRHPSFMALSLFLLVHIMRTGIFTFANYSRLSSLGIIPGNFDQSNVAGLVHISSVLLSAYFLVIGLLKTTGWNKILPFSLAWWAYFSIHLGVVVRLIFRMDFPPFIARLLSEKSIYYLPFGIAKAVVVVVCLVVVVRKLEKGSRRSVFFVSGCVGIAISQVFDLLVRVIEVYRPDLLAIFYCTLYAGIVILMLGIRKDSAAAVPETRLSSMEDDFARKFGLNANERQILEAILSGASNKEIAFNENISLSAVKHRIFALYKKLGVSSRYELLARGKSGMNTK